MLSKLKNIRDDYYGKRQDGFTIVEVMIVLAIAGLIILIVFLAVPALQRNSRNTQRKNDAAALLGAVNEYMTNHNGQVPPAKADIAAKAAYYDVNKDKVLGGVFLTSGAQTIDASTAANDYIVISKSAKCNDAGTEAVIGPARAVAAVFLIETAGGYTPVCQEG